jgi:hypothetical protein
MTSRNKPVTISAMPLGVGTKTRLEHNGVWGTKMTIYQKTITDTIPCPHCSSAMGLLVGDKVVGQCTACHGSRVVPKPPPMTRGQKFGLYTIGTVVVLFVAAALMSLNIGELWRG